VAYKALSHQHIGEVAQLLATRGWTGEIDFVPHSAPLVRGIHLTTVVDAPSERVEALYQGAYQDSCFVSLHQGPVNMGSVVGSNRAAIGWTGQGERTAIFCAIDNLIKGGAGQGLQNLNLLMGWPESEGLNVFGQWP
jgi:N-acetyl-gamma-glutamyl-phosphate reductase